MINTKKKVLSLLVASALAQTTYAQTASESQGAESDEEESYLEKIVVTGVSRGTRALETSVSTSSIDFEKAQLKTAPRSLGEIYRSLPGIRSEPATGEGNGSVSIRGIPLATGGYKYVQLQEDGLPVLQFGDIVAGNVPNFIRGDFTLSYVEAIRGGSASTLATYSPGGIINHISKDGELQEGSIGLSYGLDFDELRTDFAYGSGELGNSGVFFHIGGYFREGEGARDVGYNANSGSHLKFSLTKEFDNGYVRVMFKNIDENIATYTRSPVIASGPNGGSFDPFPGFDGRDQDVGSINRTNVTKYDRNGNRINRDTSDGIHVDTTSFGVEASFDLANDWVITNRFRTSENSGSFFAPLILTFGDAQDVAGDGFWGCGCDNTVTFENGPNAGQVYNGPAAGVLELDFNLDDLGLTVNDLRLSKEYDKFAITAGLYFSSQDIVQSWNSWDFYLMQANGDNASPLSVYNNDADTQHSLPGGVIGSGFLANFIDINYETLSPYFDINWNATDDLTINASVRRDSTEVRGLGIKGGQFFGGGVISTDRNNDGDLDDALDQIAVATLEDNALATVADYDRDFTSYSVGANYVLSDNSALFSRYSKGGVLVADRLWDGSNAGNNRLLAANTGLLEGIDEVTQFEFGYKTSNRSFNFGATAFYAETDETQSEITSRRVFTQTYEATGIELEGNYTISDNFLLSGNFTWTDAEIVAAEDPSVIGNQPNRQADYIFTITPEYVTDNFNIGASFVGSGDFYHGDTESVKQDAYVLIHMFASYYVTDNLTLNLTSNNVTNELVNSFSESGVFNYNNQNINLGEVLNGRTTNLSLIYRFY